MYSEDILGVQVHPTSIEQLLEIISNLIKENNKEIIGNHNLHSIYLVHNDLVMKKFYSQTYLNHVDGMPLIFWLKILGKRISTDYRITYVDLIHPLLDMANQKRWKMYYLGSKPGIASKASKILEQKYNNVNIKTSHGYFKFNSKNDQEIIKEINKFQPELLLVGMGMPRQENWILNNYEHLNSNIIMNAGACFDYIANEAKTPPRILGKIGLEWLYRLLNEPRRLWQRYLYEPITLLPKFYNDLRKKK